MKKTNNKGITLIALVVTIIVLIILAAVTINMVLGENGILQKSADAKADTVIGSEKEEIALSYNAAKIKTLGGVVTASDLQEELDSVAGIGKTVVTEKGSNGILNVLFNETKHSYDVDGGKITQSTEVDWDKVFEEAEKHPDQDEKEEIGIDSWGNVVDLDSWFYYKEEDSYHIGFYASGREVGYRGEFTGDGRIIGEIPKFIKGPDDNEFLPVTSLDAAFYQCEKLKIAPIIPDTVKEMEGTFYECTSLIEAPEIPNGVETIANAFVRCTSLETAPVIPYSVRYMGWAFYECSKLKGTLTINGIDAGGYQVLEGAATETEEPLLLNGMCARLSEILKTKSPESNIIIKYVGIDLNGNEVDMSLWTYKDFGDWIALKEYVGDFNNGEIIGQIPKCIGIKGNDESTYKPVETMDETFSGCTNLTTAPIIPDNIIGMYRTFYGCSNLKGTLTINANPEYCDECLTGAATENPLVLNGSSTMLLEILEEKSDNSKITIE